MARERGGERPARESHREASRGREAGRAESREKPTREAPAREARERPARERMAERVDRGDRMDRGSRERARERNAPDRSPSRERAGRQREGAERTTRSREAERTTRDQNAERTRERQARERATTPRSGRERGKDAVKERSARVERSSPGSRPERSSGGAHRAAKEATPDQSRSLERALGAKDVGKMSRGDFEKLHRELGAEHMQIRQHEGRVDVSFTDRTGTERTWSRGGTERTISVHDYELGRDRGAPAPRQPERTSPTRTETRAAGPPARESRTPAREPVREPRTHDPKAPRERPEREGRSAGPTTNGSPPRRPPVPYPPGFSPEATVRLGEEMRQRFARDPIGKYLWFFDAVRTGGQMDLKKYGKTKEEKERFAPAGNYNYGLLGRALGIPDEVLRSGAGAWQLVDAARRWASGGRFTYRAEWGVPFFSDSRGDDPVDQHWIRRGVRDYELGIGTPLEPPPPLLEPHDPALPRIH